MVSAIRLGVNIDHVATLRNQRNTSYPDLLEAASVALRHGADGITVHLREDRRHIRDADVFQLRSICPYLNLEMAATEEMCHIAKQVVPNACCLVPEKRHELTTEGGLDVISSKETLFSVTARLHDSGIMVSFFVDPSFEQILMAKECGADIVELHTGEYASLSGVYRDQALFRLIQAADFASSLGLRVHAGHGLDLTTVSSVLSLPALEELNIGYSIVARALFVGFSQAVSEMKQKMSTVFLG